MQEVFDNWLNRLLNKDVYPHYFDFSNAAKLSRVLLFTNNH